MSLLSELPTDLTALTDADLEKLAGDLLELQAQERRENQLRYYQPASPPCLAVHLDVRKTVGIGGGNGASKTDTALAEMVIRATGQIPLSLRDVYPREKLRGPIACRVVCESITTTLVPTILPKLQWHQWRGEGQPGTERGHWGWIPKHCLIDGDWKKSWREKERMLRLYYRDPDDSDRILGESYVQFMSYDQDPSDFASGDFHFILHDEPPKERIWIENMARVMRVDGTMMLAMTWPEDPGIPVDWIYDRIYEKAQAGTECDKNIAWYTLSALDNPNIKQSAVVERAKQMSAREKAARIFGQPLRMANRVHPLFTDANRFWCFTCRDITIRDDNGQCGTCQNDVIVLNHVQPVKANDAWPVVFGLDPHPRKAHYLLWAQISPNDDIGVVHSEQVDGGPAEVRDVVQRVEGDYGWRSVRRLIDPNMGRSPSDTKRELTWQDAFEQVGIVCDLADDSDVGRRALDEYLEPDEQTRQPRFTVDPRNSDVIYQIKRFSWDDFKSSAEKGQKQRPKAKHDDYPAILRYILNSQPSFRGLKQCGQVYRREGVRSAIGY